MTRFGQPRPWVAIVPGADGIEVAATDVARRFDNFDAVKQVCRPGKNRIITAISSADVWCHVLTLPATDLVELGQMIRLQVQELSPLAPEETVLGFVPLERIGNTTRILLAIAPKAATVERVEALDNADLEAETVSVDVIAVFHHLLRRSLLPRDESLHLFVRIEPRGAALIAHSRGLPLLVRFILATDADELAEEIRRTWLALVVEHPNLAPGETVLAADGGGLTRHHIVRLVPDETVMSADTVNVLVEDLFRKFSGNVRRLDADDIPAVAVALRADATGNHTDTFNLLSEDWRDRRLHAQLRRRIVRGAIAVAAVYALALLGFGAAHFAQSLRLRGLNAQIAKLQPPYADARQARTALTTMESRLDTQQTALEMLRESALLLPDGARLTGFNFKKGQSVTLRGETSSAALASDYIGKLERSPLFLNVKTISMPTAADGLTKFEVVCTLKPIVATAGGAS